MNLKQIRDVVLGEGRKLQKGNPKEEKELGDKLVSIAQEIEKQKNAIERPITAETLKGVRVGRPKFKPRKL